MYNREWLHKTILYFLQEGIHMFRDIPGSENWLDVIPVNAGWSGDEKFHVTDENGRALLVRISPAERFERRKSEFETLKHLNDRIDANIPQALGFGNCTGGIYTLLTWVEGKPAEEVLPALPREQQSLLGKQAGEIARCLHRLPAPEQTEAWPSYFLRKMTRKAEQYQNCLIQISECGDFAAYVQENAHLLQGRQSFFQHGDLHVGNMVISDRMELGLVDFDRMSWGDPWEEFNRITWSVQCSPVFASSMLRSYFDGAVPDSFWRLLALYIASNQLSCIPWAIPFGEEQVRVMIDQCREVRAWYPKDYGQGVSAWYAKEMENQ